MKTYFGVPVLPAKYNDKSQAWRAGYFGVKPISAEHEAGAAQAAKDRFIAECKASIESLNGEILKAIDYRDFTKADRLDRQRDALHKAISKAKATGSAA
jgi:hypothetical protein